MAPRANLAVSKPSESTRPLECDIPVRNTFIHFDDNLDGDDDDDVSLPLFSQHTWSTPADLCSKRRTLSCDAREEPNPESSELVGAKAAEREMAAKDLETLGLNLASHKAGLCVPCVYFISKPAGCKKGSDCDRCHICTKTGLHRWKRTMKKARAESRRRAREVEEIIDSAPKEQLAFTSTPARLEESGACSDDVCEYRPRPLAVKNTFIHFSDDEDEGELSVRMCKSDASPYTRQTVPSGLDIFRPRPPAILAGSASLDGRLKRLSRSGHSSRSTSPGPPGGRCRWQSSSSDTTEVETASDEDSTEYASPPASPTAQGTLTTNLETRGASFEAHQIGDCQPCFYFSSKADGCRKGADCIYCHFCSSEESKQRKRVTKMLAKQLKKAYETRCRC